MGKCIVRCAVLLCCAACVVSCGSDDSAGDKAADAAADADAGTDVGMCIADDLACGEPDGECRGDCQGRTCCSGLCAGAICAPENVEFGSSCRDRCGGDAEGTWRLVGACIPSSCDGRGAISCGTLTVGVDSTDALAIGYDFHCGGYIDTGGAPTVAGTWDPDLPTIGGHAYCVDGDRLFITLVYRDRDWVSGAVLELRRM